LGIIATQNRQVGFTEFQENLKLFLIDSNSFGAPLIPLDGTGGIFDVFFNLPSASDFKISMIKSWGKECTLDNTPYARIVLLSNNIIPIAVIPQAISDNKFELKLDPSQAVTAIPPVGVLSLVKPVNTYNTVGTIFNVLPQLNLTTDDLQKRREFIKQIVEENSKWGNASQWGDGSHLKHIKEAYYVAPLYFAMELQRRGDYQAALDVFKTFYDFTADESNDPNARKIYYGFVLEKEDLPLTSYQRTQDWLLNPLDPHAIAETRKDCNLRFTLFAIIRCLLEFADAEFTQDTAESTARARSLYLTAQGLLESKELKQGLNGCDEIIGFLDNIFPPDSRWQPSFLELRESFNAIPDLQTRNRVLPRIRAAFSTTEPIEQQFANARQILNRAKTELPPAPTLTQLIEQTENTNLLMHRSLMADSALQPALDDIGMATKENLLQTITRILGIAPTQLQDKNFAIPSLREAVSSRVDVAKPIRLFRDESFLDGLNTPDTAPVDSNLFLAQNSSGYIPQLITAFFIPANPILQSLRQRTNLNLKKLRAGLNIAGLKRQLEPYSAPIDTTSGLPSVGNGGQLVSPVNISLQPTLYRYQVLIDRAKQLVQLAVQLETSYFGAETGLLSAQAGILGAIAGQQSDEVQRRDKQFDKGYALLKARQDLGLAQAGIQLQNLRLKEAFDGVGLAQAQKQRSQIQANTYQNWLNAGLNGWEKGTLEAYEDARGIRNRLAVIDAALTTSQVAVTALSGGFTSVPAGLAAAGIVGSLSSLRAWQTIDLNNTEAKAQINSAQASFERRKQEWQLQEDLAKQDLLIGTQQITLANDRVGIVGQEKSIAVLQTSNANDAVEYLAGRITENPELTKTLQLTVQQFQLTAELYDYIKGILQGVYRYFLQQATATAKLAENQLAFERQEVPPAYIQADYWSAPTSNLSNTNPNPQAPDRQGLTGSARLLQDVYQLDQYAFNTNKRKLQLTKTFSLSLLAPTEFQRFRETGVILFSTPMELFDRDFPGHYLRLIRRVRTSVIALIPPSQGIHATLSTVGITRVVIGPEVFQTIPIRRDPEFVALTSPTNATGLFELENLQPDFLLPFEGNGVDSSWEFRMPKAANQFDYRTIADVLITIEYTALNSNDYRQQVIQTLDPTLSADRPFSFRSRFADQWYDLNNPEQTKTPMKVKFQTFREDFPPNVESLKIQQVLLYFVRASQTTFELPITELRFTELGNQGTVGGAATPIDGIISTRRGNAGSWTATIGKSPIGEWELTLPNTEEVKKRFEDEELDDILFVITYEGRTPEWPT
jgi:Tc toxin complex TcA C-terminal TcB-binding domain